MIEEVLAGYAGAAEALIPRYEDISSEELLAPVLDLLPAPPARVLELGAGTGRDAAWLARQGYRVTAVEPVALLRQAAGALHASAGIEWLDDRLPGLASLEGREGGYDLLLLCAVWQHLDDARRRLALHRLAALAAPGGRLVLSLRHGPGAPTRPVVAVRPDDTIAAAEREGFVLLRRHEAESRQPENRAAGVRWTWLAFASR